MQALGEIALAIAAFILEMTVHAAVFIFLLLMAIFSPRYRKRLREHWDTTNWRRFAIVLGIAMDSVVLIFALFVWTTFLAGDAKKTAAIDRDPATTIELSEEEIQKIGETIEIHELVDVAGEIIKRRLAERKQEVE